MPEAGLEPGWETSNAKYGISTYDPRAVTKVEDSKAAGLNRAECAYHEAAFNFPRFVRQGVRGLLDEAIITGAKQPHPELLRRVPHKERLPSKPPTGASGHALRESRGIQPPATGAGSERPPPTGLSGRSGRSRSSAGSNGSRRSLAASAAGSAIARAGVSSGPGPGWLRQPTPNLHAAGFNTTSSQYGVNHDLEIGHAGRGREVWMMGRGGGQTSTFDNSLVDKSRTVRESHMH